MLGNGLQFGHVRTGGGGGEDQFYIPVKAKRSNNNHKQNQHQKANNNSHNNSNKTDENGEVNGKTSKQVNGIDGGSIVSRSNLERFLKSTTPSVTAQTTMRGWRTCDVTFFTLGDLWESFKQWSAYGAGVPLVLDGSDSVVQYYVPYLSGIQLYGESATNSTTKSRQAGEDSDGDYYRDSSSDGSSDCEFEKGMKFSRELTNHLHLSSDIPYQIGSLSLSDERCTNQEGFSSDDSETGNSRGRLLFQFLERDTPYSREPLADKIVDLARQYPGLNTLRSCDLLPISWISVAWYPIYRIPTGQTLKDLDACFLTYHLLATPLGGSGSTPAPVVTCPDESDGVPHISLPVFGLASHKFKCSMWTQNGARELKLVNSLMQAANKWLRFLQVNHPDFEFFTSHSRYHR